MANFVKQEEGGPSHTVANPSDREHTIDISRSHDATTIDGIIADIRSLRAQVEEVRQTIDDNNRLGQLFKIQGKQFEQLKEEEGGEEGGEEGRTVNNLESIAAFKRVQNRVWIKQNTVYNEVLQDGERSLKLLTERVDRREKRIEDLTNQVFNLVGFFSVFQGVILTAVTQLSTSVTTQLGGQQVQVRPLCGKVWVPVLLSALAAIVTIVSVLLKFKHLYTLDESVHEEKHYQRAAAQKIETLQSRGADFKFRYIHDKEKKKPTTYWGLKCIAVIGALIALTVLLSLSYFVILCDKWVVPGWN